MTYVPLAFLGTLIACSCSAYIPEGEPIENAELIEEIEASISLPNGARPISEYSRHYAFEGSDKVVGTYIIPRKPLSADTGCEVALENFESRPCNEAELEELTQMDASIAKRNGQRDSVRWHDSTNSMPVILDGGCSFIRLAYLIESKAFEYVECNGEA